MYLIHKIQDHCSTSVLTRSTNNGTSWSDQIGGTSLVWPDSNGFDPNAVLQYGEAQAGGLSPDSTGTQYLYIYFAGNFRYSGYTGSDLIYTYPARVPESPSNAIETVTNWSYFLGTTAAGDPIWSTSDNDAEAAPVWADLNNADSVSVVFDSAIGRYIAYNDHGNACTSDGSSGPCERQVSLFDAPSPWGPWTTFDYEENFDNTGCGTNCLSTGPAVGWSMVQKWIGSDGLSIWPEYSSIEVSSTADYDSLNLIEGTISLASSSTIDTLVLSTGKPAVLDTLSISNPGNLEYIDRTYRLTSVPTSYVGKEMIRLPNNDKTATASNYVSFNSTISQSVCVAWDLRNTQPTWLSSWTNTGNTLVGNTTFTVFSKAFSAGTAAEYFDFLGYTFGRVYSPKTGRAYVGTRPSKKSVHRMIVQISEHTHRSTTWQDADTVVQELNRMLLGWANYFRLGLASKAYRAINSHTTRRLGQWLCKKHKIRGHGTVRYSRQYLYQRLGLLDVRTLTQRFPWAKA